MLESNSEITKNFRFEHFQMLPWRNTGEAVPPRSSPPLYMGVITLPLPVFTPRTLDNDIINTTFEKVILDNFSRQT